MSSGSGSPLPSPLSLPLPRQPARAMTHTRTAGKPADHFMRRPGDGGSWLLLPFFLGLGMEQATVPTRPGGSLSPEAAGPGPSSTSGGSQPASASPVAAVVARQLVKRFD